MGYQILRELRLVCDLCEGAGVYNALTVGECKRLARGSGWVVSGQEAYCPQCSRAANLSVDATTERVERYLAALFAEVASGANRNQKA